MNNEMNDKLFLTGRAHYGEAFWKAMRGNDAAYTDLAGAKHNLTNTYLLPESTATKYSASLKEHNLFRRIGTVMNATKMTPLFGFPIMISSLNGCRSTGLSPPPLIAFSRRKMWLYTS